MNDDILHQAASLSDLILHMHGHESKGPGWEAAQAARDLRAAIAQHLQQEEVTP